MKKSALLLAFSLACLGASADSTVVFEVKTADDQKKEFDIRNVDYIDFQGDVMYIHYADGTEGIDIASIEEMVFNTITGIEEVRDFTLPGDIQISVDRGILSAALPGQMLTLRIFDMQGHAVDMASAESELTYNLADLPKGLYIIMVNDKAIKYIR